MSAISVYFVAFGLRIAGWHRLCPQWFPGETFPEMHDLQEAYEMITNRFEEWKERQRLVGASQAELEHLADGVLDATSLDDLFQ
ncbi:MAG: hypothetical protein U9Q93_09660 [Pseudomonadota bacterium]|nr:hypothetical protein [Pseudomonadota bacterium]